CRFDEGADKQTASGPSGVVHCQSAQSLREMESRSRNVSETASRSCRKTSRVGPEQTSARVSRHHLVSVWHAVAHGKFWAGLVRHYPVVCGFADGLDRRATNCCSPGSLWSDLRERGCLAD